MSAIFEGRPSDSPYIEFIWRGRVEQDYSPTCPADVRWNLLFTFHNNRIKVTAEGATSGAVFKNNYEGAEFLVIRFKLGTYMPYLPAGNIVNTDALLPQAAGRSFWLNGCAWPLPDFENAETFVERLARNDVLVTDPIVKSALRDDPLAWSSRTVRRRFLAATGLTPKVIEQIERAKAAVSLLEQGVPILDVVYQSGYADQPHMTRSLRRYYGLTPAQIAKSSQVSAVS